ncbi:MAG TPA: hypothetical protein VI670_15085 [Thermoanaerobaculia bacterium]|jgi:pimeloyl-ACP methyl ester carboxylesterase
MPPTALRTPKPEPDPKTSPPAKAKPATPVARTGNEKAAALLGVYTAARDATYVASKPFQAVFPTREALDFAPGHLFLELLAKEVAYSSGLTGHYLYRARYSDEPQPAKKKVETTIERADAAPATTKYVARPDATYVAGRSEKEIEGLRRPPQFRPHPVGSRFATLPIEPEVVSAEMPLIYRVIRMPGSDEENKKLGLSAYALVPLRRGDAPAILAFRGTDAFPDLVTDLGPGGAGATAFTPLRDRIKTTLRILRTAGNGVIVTGHSLGGATAQLTTAAFPGDVSACVTFNSPGIDEATLRQFELNTAKMAVKPKVSHYVTRGDVVSPVGETRLPGAVTMFDSVATRTLETLYVKGILDIAERGLKRLNRLINELAAGNLELRIDGAQSFNMRLEIEALKRVGEVFKELHGDRLLPVSVPIDRGTKTTAWKTQPPVETIGIGSMEKARRAMGKGLSRALALLASDTFSTLILASVDPVMLLALPGSVARAAAPLTNELVKAIDVAGGLRGLVKQLLYVDPKSGQIAYWLPELVVTAPKKK